MSMTSFWCLCYFLTDFTHCSGVSIIVNFEQVNGTGQLAFTCSKSTTETLGKGWAMI